MPLDRRLAVMRVLDDQNNLSVRADTKAVSFLSALGMFAAFFILWARDVHPDYFTITIMVLYSLVAIMALWNIILAINPRIRGSDSGDKKDRLDPYRAAFFAEICKFSTLPDYKECLDKMLKDEETVIDVYARQIYEVSRIAAAKYKYTQRAVYCVISALSLEFILIVYMFVTNAVGKMG
jgi:hypothetical protein